LPVGLAWKPPIQTTNNLTLSVDCTSQYDFDCDGDVDTNDVTLYKACASGPSMPVAPGCENRDIDHDNDANHDDFGALQRCYSGANPTQPEFGRGSGAPP